MSGFADPGAVAITEYVLGAAPADDRPAVVDHTRGSRREFTYRELRRAVAGLAGHLRRSGVRDGDAVGVAVENSYEFVVAYHGVLAAGGVVLTLDPRDPAHESGADRDGAGIAALITERLTSGGEGIGTVFEAGRTIVVDDGAPDGATPWKAAVDAAAEPVAWHGGDRPAVLMRSSGTTGAAKRITVTHRNIVANLAQIAELHRLPTGTAVAAIPPLRHIYGMQMAMNPVLRAGATLVLPATPFRVDDFLDLLRAYRVELAYTVPSVLAEIAAAPAFAPLPRLRRVVSGGAPLPAQVARGAAERLGAPVVQGFGMTEAGCLFFTPDDRPAPAGSVGIPVPGTEIRLVDPASGARAEPGGPGELWVRGPQVVPGAVETAGPAQGWLRTGDLVATDAEGFVRITGRIKSMIKYKGNQVWPAELEDVLTTHPAVREALVCGVPDPVAGEIPKAYVVLGEQVPLATITEYAAGMLAPHKRVRMIERVRAIPRSATGKPVRPPALRVLVSGGSRGLGREFAVALAAAGARVLVTGRDEQALRETVRLARDIDGAAEYVVADLTAPGAADLTLHRITESFGGIDILIANAGVAGPIGPIWEVDEAAWWATMETNVRATVAMTRAAVPHLIAQGSGRLVHLVSNAGRHRWPHAAAYSISKAALISLNANLAGELRGTGVTTIAYDPGLVAAGITQAHFDRGRVGDPFADRILDWATAARARGGLTPVADSTRALVAAALGAADHRSGEYVTVGDLLPAPA
ncbi:SDR family NAD(P)-dependent oxidoreductase [Nocardia higoensis]|uniref:SDR family NAD(P)-dependent oxidoreductase n=1 Tax=Nocardia higoensis TaxID=228599 RepID=UPI0005928FAA|nr:SDR family NAD(P)-dependent oxidoreductase [Nocardia higoensis]